MPGINVNLSQPQASRPAKVSTPETMTDTQHSALWEIVVGILLIIVQFILNRSFLGTGFSKWYFDIVFFCFLFLIFISCRKDFFKVAIISVFSIYFGGVLLNHINALQSLAGLTSLHFFSQDLLSIAYYVILIIVTTIFTQAIIKDETVDYMGFGFVAILSIIIPFVIVKFPFSNYLLLSDQAGSLLKLFFSIPLLWQPFWISGLAKAKTQGSKAAYIFLMIWVIFVLLITLVISYVSVPVEARNSLQTSGNAAIDDIYKTLNDTATTIKTTVIDPITIGFNPEEAAIETKVDSEQISTNKDVKFSAINFDEGTTIEFKDGLSETDKIFSSSSIISDGTDDDGYSNFNANVTCEYSLDGYAGLFNDDNAKKITVSGTINDADSYSTTLYDLRYERDLMCNIPKTALLSQVKDSAKIKLATIRANYNVTYDFFTAGYMTRYFIDESVIDAGRKKYGPDEFSIIADYDEGALAKYLTSSYTSGPIVLGIEIIKDKLIVPISSSETTSNLNLKVQMKIDGYNRGLKIKNANAIIISVPESLTLDGSSCSSVKFDSETISAQSLPSRIKDYIGGTTGLKFYKLSDESMDFFNMDYLNSEKRFSCPLTISNTDLENTVLKGSIGVFFDYQIQDSKISSEVTPKWVS